MPETPPSPPKFTSPRLLKLLAIAFGIGLLLFLLVWLNSRHDYDFYKADGSELATGENTALPAPLPADVAGGSNASGLRMTEAPANPAPTSGASPRIVDAPRQPPPPADTPAETAQADRSTPAPLDAPAPRYPQAALRMGEGGTVRIRVTVAADGSVAQLDIVEGSGNRLLDRAALEAVRRWTFQPAVRGGQAVAADVVVPITFAPGG